MAFDKIEVLVTSGRAGLPASAKLDCRGGGQPRLVLALQKHFIEAAWPVAAGERFDLLIGTAGEKGLLRLKRNETGVLRASIGAKGGATFNCGHIARFGDEPAAKEYCKAAVIDADTVEIVLPPWEE